MIAFDLNCSNGHQFEGWFASSGDFEGQQSRGLVVCPQCGSAQVVKAPMAPAVPRKGKEPIVLDFATSQVAMGTPTSVAVVSPSMTQPTACARRQGSTIDAATLPAPPPERQSLALQHAPHLPRKLLEMKGLISSPLVSLPTASVNLTRAGVRLTARQLEVVEMVGRAMPNKVIAAHLDLSEGTVKSHLNTIFRAIGARNRMELLLRAQELGLVSGELPERKRPPAPAFCDHRPSPTARPHLRSPPRPWRFRFPASAASAVSSAVCASS